MSDSQALVHAGRMIEFARHIPVSKLARRAELSLKRKIGGKLMAAPRNGIPAPSRASLPPLPAFAPRKHIAPVPIASGLAFTFLNRTVEMKDAAIDWAAPGADAAHQLWRMNLHYMEYLEGVGDELWMRLVTDWISANTEFSPGAWLDSWNSYALSLRIVVLLQELARRGGRLPKDLVSEVERSVAGQLRFLERNLETDLGGNHLIKNIKALIWASAYFEGDEPSRWRRKGLALLSRELKKQILADGMHYERSASYHAQVFADLLECRHALCADPFDGELDDALHRMAQVTADFTHPDGGPVLFNDSGLSMAYSPTECLDVYERQFGQGSETSQVFALEAAGYYGMRSGEIYFVADCGRIAPDDLPAHGHGDVLSFELSVGGKRMIVDQGVFEYVEGEKRRQARSAASHNTLCFEGADQADFFGAFRCGRRPDVTVLAYEPQSDGFVLEGAHDGFRHLTGKPRHVRRFEVMPGRIDIHDRIKGSPDRAARIGFLLHPDAETSVDGVTALITQGACAIRVTSTQPVEIEPAVWWPDMGEERETSQLVIRLTPPILAVTTELHILK